MIKREKAYISENGLVMPLQFFAGATETGKATFTPDNVVMSDYKTGAVPTEFANDIITGIMEGSKMMQLAKYEEMKGLKKQFSYWSKNGIGAYWVGEGRIIKTSKPTLLQATMEAHKIAVIVLTSNENLKLSMTDFFEQMKPQIKEAFYKKFDEATFTNTDNPFPTSIDQAATTATNVINGAIDYTSLVGIEGLVEDNGMEINAFVSTTRNNSDLRKVADTKNNLLYSKADKTLDDVVVVNTTAVPKGTLYGGDFDMVRYGIPQEIEYKILEEATLSSIVGEDGKPVNLAERDLVAMRVTMHMGFAVLNNEAFAAIKPV